MPLVSLSKKLLRQRISQPVSKVVDKRRWLHNEIAICLATAATMVEVLYTGMGFTLSHEASSLLCMSSQLSPISCIALTY